MAGLTVEQRLEKLERFIRDGALHLETHEKGGMYLRELELIECPVCKHATIQIKEYEDNLCLTCGHKLASRIVAID